MNTVNVRPTDPSVPRYPARPRPVSLLTSMPAIRLLRNGILHIGLLGIGLMGTGLLASAAHAQYQWVDAQGQKVYSDQPPPAGTKTSQMTHKGLPVVPPSAAPAPASVEGAPTALSATPAGFVPAAGPGGSADAAASAGSAASADDRSARLAREAAEFQKRRAERLAEEQKATKAAQETASKEQACTEARQSLRTYESGGRIATVRSSGEREYLSDDELREQAQRYRSKVHELCPSS